MKRIIFILLTFLLSCSSQSNNIKRIDITIDRISTKFDLKNEVYIVKRNGGDYVAKFTLTLDEKQKISKLYNELELNVIENGNYGNCGYLPVIATTLIIHTNNDSSKIVIDENCESLLKSNLQAKKIKQFLDSVGEILLAKPSIKNAPKSDMFFM